MQDILQVKKYQQHRNLSFVFMQVNTSFKNWYAWFCLVSLMDCMHLHISFGEAQIVIPDSMFRPGTRRPGLNSLHKDIVENWLINVASDC